MTTTLAVDDGTYTARLGEAVLGRMVLGAGSVPYHAPGRIAIANDRQASIAITDNRQALITIESE